MSVCGLCEPPSPTGYNGGLSSFDANLLMTDQISNDQQIIPGMKNVVEKNVPSRKNGQTDAVKALWWE